MIRFAALDLGSNSFLCLIGEGDASGIYKILSDEMELVRLGEGLSHSKSFQVASLQRADQALEKFAAQIKKYRPQKILAMATAAARDAQNKEELFRICQKHGIPVEIIPGSMEAQITFQGAQCSIGIASVNQNHRPCLVVDVGGRSTEIIYGVGPRFHFGQSLRLGVVDLSECHHLSASPAKRQIDEARAKVQEALRLLSPDFCDDLSFEMKAVAGTPTTIAQIMIGAFDPERIENMVITKEDFLQKIQEFTRMEAREIREKYRIPEKRADVILAGCLVLAGVMDFFNKQQLIVSTRGVRFGVALEILKEG